MRGKAVKTTKSAAARDAYQGLCEHMEQDQLLNALPVLKISQHVADALDVTSRNLVGAAAIEAERKAGRQQKDAYRFRLTPKRELPEDESYDARVIAHSSVRALDAIAGILDKSLDAALHILQSEDGRHRRYAAGLLVSQLNRAIKDLLQQSTAPWGDQIAYVASQQMEFPSLMSLSRKINNDRDTLVLKHLKLGKKLPFTIDPRNTYTPYTRLAMQIVSFIDTDRRRKASIYRKVVPGFEKKNFSRHYRSAWEKVIGFHLDFFQSSEGRRRKFVAKQDTTSLQAAMEDRLEWEENNRCVRTFTLGPFAEIANVIEFKYRQGRPVKMTAGTLFNRVKFKVIEAAMALLPK